ncbi:unnamed protein product [Nezara viridula]|uniref:Uncharacterized protein n=1 Tax=Nezara viridula TaxID=85310 RepID=A0A9P0MQV8_NEZVI|nr:unnamed protein product [Nezara viridula]
MRIIFLDWSLPDAGQAGESVIERRLRGNGKLKPIRVNAGRKDFDELQTLKKKYSMLFSYLLLQVPEDSHVVSM